MATVTQSHLLQGGETLKITRNGIHQYALNGGPWAPSVTTLNKHVSEENFGAIQGFTLKTIRENNGDLDAPRRIGAEAIEIGTTVHQQISTYINDGLVAEENPVFVAWLKAMQHVDFLASERFIYNTELNFGGTFDAVAIDPNRGLTLFDWKTKDRESFERHEISTSWMPEQAQLAAYIHSLWSMKSAWLPTRGVICYLMRDGSFCVQREIDLSLGWDLFVHSRKIHTLIKERKDSSREP